MALTGEAKVENTTLISMAARRTRRFPFAPAPSFVTTNCFKSSRNEVWFKIPPKINRTTSEITVLLEKPAHASLKLKIPVICRSIGTARAVAAMGI